MIVEAKQPYCVQPHLPLVVISFRHGTNLALATEDFRNLSNGGSGRDGKEEKAMRNNEITLGYVCENSFVVFTLHYRLTALHNIGNGTM